MILFIKDLFHKAACNVPSYITQKLYNIHDFFLPTSLQHNLELPEGENNIDSDFVEQDNTNIFNQQNNNGYLLQDKDIYLITQDQNINILPIAIQDIWKFNKPKAYQPHYTSNSWIKSFYNNIMSCVERIFFSTNKNYEPSGDALVTAIKSLYSSSGLSTGEVEDNSLLKSQHFLFNLDYSHWACLSLVKNKENLYVLYKDSLEIYPHTKTQIELYIKNIAQYALGIEGTKIKFIANANIEQKDAISCGIFALQNVKIIQQKLLGANPESFLENFAESKEFCKSERISNLRKEYAEKYLSSNVQDIIESQRSIITRDALKNKLKENLNTANNLDLEEQINTYVDSYNPNAQLEDTFSSPFYSSAWVLNKYYPKSYTFHDNTTYPQISGAENGSPEEL